MKVRIHKNSLRFRMSRSDVEQIRQKGRCSEALQFGSGSQLTYTLEASSQCDSICADYGNDCIRVYVPLALACSWADSDQVSLVQEPFKSGELSVVIEKDFQCLHGGYSASEGADAYPNPSALPVRAR